MPIMSRARRSVTTVVVLALLIAGCGGAPAPDALARLALTASPSCPSNDPYPLSFRLDSPQDQAALGNDLAICTNGADETVVSNSSERVWVVTDPPGLHWSGLAPTSAALLFEDASNLLGDGTGLALGPGMAARIAVSPDQVRARLDLSYLTMWQFSKFSGDAFDKKGQAAAKLLLSDGAPLRGAAASCAVGAYFATREIANTDVPAGTTYADWVPTAVGLSGDLRTPVTTCVKDWRAAEKASRSRIAVPPVVAEELQDSAVRGFWRNAANSAYSVFRKVGTAVSRIHAR